VEVHSESLGGTFIVSATPIADRTSDQHRTILSLKDITALRDGIARLDGALRGTIQAMAAMVERRDPYTAGHERRVCKLAMAIVEEMALSEQQTTAIELAAVIHDVGKIGVPAEILSKPGALSSIEFELVKSHSQVGYEILKDIAFPWPIAQIVWQHHERLDGSGYPLGLRSEEILLEARVIAVADVVEAMSSHRPYRPAHTMVETVAEISNDRGIRYDAAVVDACLKVLNAAGSQVADIWSEGGAGSG
jgi:HD-GYP domain-containing protein (c-di-GMP phosphodiesterase class II)